MQTNDFLYLYNIRKIEIEIKGISLRNKDTKQYFRDNNILINDIAFYDMITVFGMVMGM